LTEASLDRDGAAIVRCELPYPVRSKQTRASSSPEGFSRISYGCCPTRPRPCRTTRAPGSSR
jgi:hypothetical protein